MFRLLLRPKFFIFAMGASPMSSNVRMFNPLLLNLHLLLRDSLRQYVLLHNVNSLAHQNSSLSNPGSLSHHVFILFSTTIHGEKTAASVCGEPFITVYAM